MLTPDLVPVRRKSGTLHLTPIVGKVRQHHLELAEAVCEVATSAAGVTREQLQADLVCIGQSAAESRIVKGYSKIVEDATTFELDRGRGAAERRERLFEAAARRWQSLQPGERFHREAVLSDVASTLETGVEQFEAELFVDLPSAQRVITPVRWTANELVDRYDEARIAAVLLRAVRVEVSFEASSPSDLRRLFRTLKFRQLMFELEREASGRYRLTLTGPYSLFEAVTKYGLQLALCWPELKLLDGVKLRADLRWGKSNERLEFEWNSREDGPLPRVRSEPTDFESDEVKELARALGEAAPDATISSSDRILDLPGVGLCVPDLCYRTPTGSEIYLEVLGFWSRANVWRRVELVEGGLVEPVLFIASSRLRVSEEVLDDSKNSALYVYRGRINPAKVLGKLNGLASRLPHVGKPTGRRRK